MPHWRPQGFGWDSKVTAHDRTWTVKELSRSPHCFVSGHALYYRIATVWPECDPCVVEAALCFPTALWSHFRKHGFITEEHLALSSVDLGEAEELTGMAARVAGLSVVQRQVLGLSMIGWKPSRIALRIKLSPGTIAFYRHNIKLRLGIASFADPALEDPDVHALIEPAFTAV